MVTLFRAAEINFAKNSLAFIFYSSKCKSGYSSVLRRFVVVVVVEEEEEVVEFI